MSVSVSSLRTLAGRFLIALVVGSVLMAGAVAGVNEEIGNKIASIPKINLVTAPERPGGANYLLVGSDTRGFVSNELEEDAFGDATVEEGQRSDTIMVVHLEPKAERTFVLSFPRDLAVNIPGHGYGKINSAYSYGNSPQERAQTLIDTLKQNFDIDIQHFLELDFKSFVGLVNELGTVPMYVPYEARDEDTGFHIENPGCVALNGETSLQWARSRSLEYRNPTTDQWVYQDQNFPDIQRIGRQQDFMRRLAGLAVQKSLANPFTAYVVADKVTAGLKADDAFDRGAVNALIDAFRTLNPNDQSALEFATMPWKGGPNLSDGQSVLYPKLDDPAFDSYLERLRTFNSPPKPTPPPSSIRVRVVNASGQAGLAVAVTNTLKEFGFQTVEPVENPREKTIDGVDVRISLDEAAKGNLVSRYVSPTAQVLVAPASDVDVTLVLGRAFEAIVQPADALQVTDTTVPPAPVEGEPVVTPPPIVEEPALGLPPYLAPPSSFAAQVPPAPRGNC